LRAATTKQCAYPAGAASYSTAPIAARWLHGCDAVIAPAEDGGYPLIGLKHASAVPFEGVAWSTAAVMGQTRARFAQLGWRWRELRMLWDVDRPEDLARLRESRFPGRPY
ncbi:MAG: DUF2064 domain-containing protein, partial [Betaproteobacteria bacterium]|nr:DUF2064 domain-containing protein [Betaproteobacteria bacterium]